MLKIDFIGCHDWCGVKAASFIVRPAETMSFKNYANEVVSRIEGLGNGNGTILCKENGSPTGEDGMVVALIFNKRSAIKFAWNRDQEDEVEKAWDSLQ